MDDPACSCGSGQPYPLCCGPLHDGTARAATAEQLMRSRYSAFVDGRTDYLLRTWHPSTRPARLRLDDDVRWVRLEVLAVSAGGVLDRDGVVEFRAVFARGGVRAAQHEVSRFVRGSDGWAYLDGVQVRD